MLNAPLIPHIILPTQTSRGSAYSPEQSLMIAVLKECQDTILRGLQNPHSPRAEQAMREARAWVASETTAWPFAFVTICETLNLEVAYVRDTLAKLSPTINQKRRGLQGEPLPIGICMHPSSRASPYQVTEYHRTGSAQRYFATVEEAVAFRNRLRQTTPRKRIHWEKKPVLRATRKIGSLCVLCAQPIVYGDSYRRANSTGCVKSAHDSCILQAI